MNLHIPVQVGQPKWALGHGELKQGADRADSFQETPLEILTPSSCQLLDTAFLSLWPFASNTTASNVGSSSSFQIARNTWSLPQ